MGRLDRILRIVLALLFVALYATNVITGTLGIVLIVASGIFLITSFLSFCPLYTVFGLNTCSVKNKAV